MGVHKFRSIEEMSRAPVEHRSAPEFERFLRHAARFALIAPRHYPRGVFKFRTVDEARAARQKR
jgi:hypothetical protein